MRISYSGRLTAALGLIAFVDDFTAWVAGPTAEGNSEGINAIIEKAMDWERGSSAISEAEKTAVIHFTRSVQIRSPPFAISDPAAETGEWGCGRGNTAFCLGGRVHGTGQTDVQATAGHYCPIISSSCWLASSLTPFPTSHSPVSACVRFKIKGATYAPRQLRAPGSAVLDPS